MQTGGVSTKSYYENALLHLIDEPGSGLPCLCSLDALIGDLRYNRDNK